MGGGTWTTTSFSNYTTATKGYSLRDFSTSNLSASQIFKARGLHPDLNPLNVMRECRASAEHPNPIPIILALDVTGSMGGAAAQVAKKLGEIMTDIYSQSLSFDPEFCIMAIGDLYCDSAPIQMSQFESDVRIAEHLDKVYFERGGGGNDWESYSGAWYMAANHTACDAFAAGNRGIIITLGDEEVNLYLNERELAGVTGDKVQKDSTKLKDMYAEAAKNWDIYHISVNDPQNSYARNNRNGKVDKSWEFLGDNYMICEINELQNKIAAIVREHANSTPISAFAAGEDISW